MIYATAQSNNATKCAKMQKEEELRKDVLNGNGECAAVAATTANERDDPPRNHHQAYTHGGRLKFFKDGKFILELERAREGERVSWVSVPRKTFWPPQGTASTPNYRQESSTSLSVSDDNSSIQSSPWQRDHSWKQTTPHRNLSKEMCFYYRRPSTIRLKRSIKRRRPYDSTHELSDIIKVVVHHHQRRTNTCNNTKSLLGVVQTLIDKLTTSSSPPRAEMVVSPRKRFLREMEKDAKVLIDEKRSRSKPTITNTTNSSSCSSSSSSNVIGKVSSSPVRVNGNTDDVKARNSSYSITSLLADVKKSPANSPSHFTTSHQYSTPGADDRWYTESVDRLRSIDLTHATAPDKRLFSAYGPSSAYVPPPFVYPYPIPTHYYPPFAAAAAAAAAAASAAAAATSRGFPVAGAAPNVYSMPLPIRPDAPSCSWAVEQPSRDIEHRDENITDMPLNLSKHAG